MANSNDVKTIPIRLASTDYELQQLKKLTKIKNMKFTPLIKYVLLCNICNQTPKRIAKVFPSTDTKPVSFIIYISENESNGVLYNWLQECQERKVKNISTYIKNLVKSAITICDNEEEQEISDIYWEYVKLEELNSDTILRKIPKEFAEEQPLLNVAPLTNNEMNNTQYNPSTEKNTTTTNIINEPAVKVVEIPHQVPANNKTTELTNNNDELKKKAKVLATNFTKNYLNQS